jgi:DNA-binding transcriptional ArsR family regulator
MHRNGDSDPGKGDDAIVELPERVFPEDVNQTDLSVAVERLSQIACPARIAMLLLLRKQDSISQNEFQVHLDDTKCELAAHLRVLTESGFVTEVETGASRRYMIGHRGVRLLEFVLRDARS